MRFLWFRLSRVIKANIPEDVRAEFERLGEPVVSQMLWSATLIPRDYTVTPGVPTCILRPFSTPGSRRSNLFQATSRVQIAAVGERPKRVEAV